MELNICGNGARVSVVDGWRKEDQSELGASLPFAPAFVITLYDEQASRF